MIRELTYKDPHGVPVKAAYADRGNVYQLRAKAEQFAQLCAQGIEPCDAYCQSHGMIAAPDTAPMIERQTKRLLSDTTVVLRIQELKAPVLRKLRRTIEYNLQKALAQCEVAYDLAYAQGDSKGILAAVRMQAELSKLLAQEVNVNHRHGLLDDASTATLLEMRKQIEVRQAKEKEKLKLTVVNVETVSEEGPGPSSGVPNGSHPEAVPN
jgi:hypothetical protein